MGCYYDPVNPRALRGTARWTGEPMTPQVCQAHCAAQGFAYAGVEWSKECFCGNELHGSFRTYDRECNMACVGDKSAKCGAGYRLNLYHREMPKVAKRAPEPEADPQARAQPHARAHAAHARRLGARLHSDFY
jgi:hypothetical protein